MMNKNWKKKLGTAIIIMALLMQQVEGGNVAFANMNEENTEFAIDTKEDSFAGVDDFEDCDEDELAGEDDFEDCDEDDFDDCEQNDFDDCSEDDFEDDNFNDYEEDDVDEEEEYGDEEWVEPSLSVTSLNLKVGKSSKIKVEGEWEEVVWKSSKKSVVKVNNEGKVTGVKAGTATIMATVYYYEEDLNEWTDVEEDYDIESSGEDIEENELLVKTFKCKVKVTANPVKLSTKKVTLKVGKSKKLKVIGATGKVTWKSSNKKVAKVSKGKITAMKPGKTTITVKANKKTLTCKVVVKKK